MALKAGDCVVYTGPDGGGLANGERGTVVSVTEIGVTVDFPGQRRTVPVGDVTPCPPTE